VRVRWRHVSSISLHFVRRLADVLRFFAVCYAVLGANKHGGAAYHSPVTEWRAGIKPWELYTWYGWR
jgi:hypothetical protein